MPACVGPLRYRDAEVARDIANLKRAVAGSGVDEAFLPAASPGILAFHLTNRHYPTYEDYLQALADAMREEYRAIAEAGLIVQVDAPDLPLAEPRHTTMCPPDVLDRYGLAGVIELHVEAIASATAGIPRERVRLHLCWGNSAASHRYDLPLAAVLEPVLRVARPGAVLFEAANRATSTSGSCSNG
jgi:5-methyltetrahydropteroyltriglutamate--homocysteine methyltransferase